ncbi:MAG: NADPH:quinone reductase [Actinomycetota bacterium]|nr:NADPH:quinone reductase [Actinomycetota bacterium]
MRVRAARLVEHGKPLQIEDVDLPEPSDGEVLVELAYAGVNPVDRYAAEGKVALEGPLPRTLGGEAAGYLDGKPVVVAGEGVGVRRDGVFAAAAVVPRAAVIEVPGGVELIHAAGIGVVGATAFRVVEIGEVGPNDRVLVLGGAGATGLAAISYAASKGAPVWGHTGSTAKVDAIREMGAKDALVSDAAGLVAAVDDLKPTVVIDALGGEFTAAVIATMAPRGRLVLFGASAGVEAKINLQLLYRNQLRLLTYGGLGATTEERREAISEALAATAEGRMRIRIGAELPLESVNEVFALFARREVAGKIVLRLR